MSTILITGGSGYIASYCILQALAQGHTVRTTVRNLAKEPQVRRTLGEPKNLQFFAADLEKDDGWYEAVAGCDYVLHVASPLPIGVPKDENELVRPAREGALRVLKAAKRSQVKRVVLTSSLAAIAYGHTETTKTFTEDDWTNPTDVMPYVKSKTLAEKAAWEFANANGLELATVNPGVVLGPVLGPDMSASIEIVRKLLNGEIPGLPDLKFRIVDVRDVADLHLRAMTAPQAKGQRFLAVSESVSMVELARTLKSKFGSQAKRVKTFQIPDFVIRIGALFVPMLRQVAPELGVERDASNRKAREMLGWKPRSAEESIVDTAESLFKYGLIKS